jgi:hypothetical protein
VRTITFRVDMERTRVVMWGTSAHAHQANPDVDGTVADP